jgi:hypothetical protein
MIISASRRTDIPAFYAKWFIRRIRAGLCMVPNPFNPSQISTIDLRSEAVDVIVFWTRFPRPLFPFIHELEDRGYRFYFQFTILNNPRLIDQRQPDLEHSIRVLCELSDRIGPQRVIWRYDPILLSNITSIQFHVENYARIAGALQGYTHRSVVSIMDFYPKTTRRMKVLERAGVHLITNDQVPALLHDLIPPIARAARENGMEIFSCAEPFDLIPYGILPGKCVDDDYIQNVFHIDVSHEKDSVQRKVCGCVKSRDIGVYNTCLFECAYCYASQNFESSRRRYQEHNPDSTSIY